MNYEEFKKEKDRLESELFQLKSGYYEYCNDLYSEYKGKKVRIVDGSGPVEVFWYGWSMPGTFSMEPIAFKVKKDGTQSQFHYSFYNVNPGNIKIELVEE